MNKGKKRIAVFLADCQSGYGRNTMKGLIKQANSLNYDILTFSFFSNHTFDYPFQVGEENIFNLFNHNKADGIILYCRSFRKTDIQKRLVQICESSGLPYIEIEDYDSDSEFKIWNDKQLFERLTAHMIEEHSLKKIYCLTGTPGQHQSENRLEGYRRAMKSHGLYFDSSYEFYGDYWESSAKELAEKIASGDVSKPEAVVCANGCMALNLTNHLISKGISVPEEIAVAGYDSFYQNALNSPSITAISNINYNQSVNAVCRLHKIITGETCSKLCTVKEEIACGESCGCKLNENKLFEFHKQDITEQLKFIDLFQASNMLQQISIAENLNDFANILSRFTYLIRGLKKLYLCICDDWDGINNMDKTGYRKKGYSDNMIMYCLNESGQTREFNSKKMLPAIYGDQSPGAYYFVPLHYEDRCFGYIAAVFNDKQYSYDKQFWTWTDNASTALEALRIRNYIRHFSERIHLTSIRDPLTGLYNRRGFEELSSEFYGQSVMNREKFLIIVFEIANLRNINKEFGYNFGDNVIAAIAEAVNSCCCGNEVCCRYGKDKFYVVGSADYTREKILSHINTVKNYCNKNITEIEVFLESSYFCDKVGKDISLNGIIRLLDEELENKKSESIEKIAFIKSFSQLRSSIYANPQKKWSIENMSQMMLLSRAYFQRLYKKEYGVSVMTDVINARIDLAKRLLIADKRSISEIAAACGYENEIYFMQQFKKVTGMTPTGYRNKKGFSQE